MKSGDSKPSLSASLEDYLEAILALGEVREPVRPKEVAKQLEVSAPSVTHALHQLKRRDLIDHEPYQGIRLTPEGRRLAKEVARKHRVLKTFFTDVLAVKEEIADKCACRMEHSIPDEVLERFIAYIQYEERCQRGGTEWVEGTGFVCNTRLEEGGPCTHCEQRGTTACEGADRETAS